MEIKDEEFIILVGPSGCGKSTTLRMIAGLEDISAGELYIGDKLVNNVAPKDRDIAMVFQNYALFPNMNVLQNVMYALTLKKETKAQAKEIALKTIENVGLSDQIHKYPHQLSGGQQQRVAIARTLATNPDVILLDEPISALDVTNREIMKAELKSLQKKFNATMLFITHDQEEAFFLSDRIMVMNEGVIEQIDTPLEIYKNPASQYVREFVVEQLDKKYHDLLGYTGRN